MDQSRCKLAKKMWWHGTHWFQERSDKKPSKISLNTIWSLCSTKFSSITDPGKRSPRVTAKSLAPNGDLIGQLQRGEHWPMQENLKKEPRCQFNYWATSEKHCTQLMSCVECKVTLCIHCFNIFHTVEELVRQKEEIAAQLLTHRRSNSSVHPQVKKTKKKQ